MRSEIKRLFQSQRDRKCQAAPPELTPEQDQDERREMAIKAQRLIHEMVKVGISWHEARPLFKKAYVLTALELENGCKSRAMRRVGLHRNDVYR